MLPESAPKAMKNTLLIIFEPRSGTMVRVSSVATKKATLLREAAANTGFMERVPVLDIPR